MSAVDDVDKLIKHYQLATAEFVKGNPEPYKELFSHREDVTLANPFFPPVRGWEQVAETLELTASLLRADLAIKCATHSGSTVGRKSGAQRTRDRYLWDFTLFTSPISRHPKSAYVSQGLWRGLAAPLFTGMRGIEILRTSPFGHSTKLMSSILHSPGPY